MRGVIFSETYSKILYTRLFQDFSGKISSYTAQIVQVIVGNSHGIKSCKPAWRIQEYNYRVCAIYTLLLGLKTSHCKQIIQTRSWLLIWLKTVLKKYLASYLHILPCYEILLSYWLNFLLYFFNIQVGIYSISIDQIHFKTSNRRTESMYLRLFVCF